MLQNTFVDQASGRRAGRSGYAQKVAMLGQSCQDGGILCTGLEFGGKLVAIMIMNSHIEAARPFGDCAPDTAHAQNAQPAAPYLAPDQLTRAPALPCPAAYKVYTLDNASCRTQHKQPGGIGAGLVQHVGCA